MSSSTSSTAGQMLMERVQALYRHRVIAALAFLAVLAVTAPFIWGLPMLYKSTATVVVEGQLSEAFVQSTLSGGINNRLEAIKQEAFSRARLTDLVQRYNLYPQMRNQPMEDALGRLQRDIKFNDVNPAQSNGSPGAVAFSITYIGRDPRTTADVANELASFFVAQNDRMRTRQAGRTTDVIRTQMEETKKRMDAQEAKVRAFVSTHMGRLPQQVDSNLAALQRLNTQLDSNANTQSKLLERKQTLQKQIADLDVAAAMPATADPSDPAVKLARAKRELADLQTQYKDTFPDVRAKKQEVQQLERDAAATGRRGGGNPALEAQRSTLTTGIREVDTQLGQLSTESKSLRDSMLSYEGRVDSAPARLPEYNALVSDYAATREQYDSLQKKYSEARLSEKMEGSTGGEEFRILDAALPAPYAAGPNRMRLLIVSLLGAIVFALGLVLIIDRFDTSFHSIDDLRAFTRVPVLVSIPDITVPADRRRKYVRTAAMVVGSAAVLLLLAAGTHHLARESELLSRALLAIG